MGKGSGICERSTLPMRSHGHRHVIYYRHGDGQWAKESDAAKKYFDVTDNLDDLQPGDVVICRFAAIPFATEIRKEITARGASIYQMEDGYAFVSDVAQWYPLLAETTFRTWFSLAELDNDIAAGYEPGSFIVKGLTNSRKDKWQTHCFASDRTALTTVIERLRIDPLLGPQGLCIREFEQLRQYCTHPETGIPIVDEYRFFVANGVILSGGYYWSDHLPQLMKLGITPEVATVPKDFLQSIVDRIGQRSQYYAMDVAQTMSGDWKLVELGDAQMAGFAGNDPFAVYAHLAQQFKVT